MGPSCANNTATDLVRRLRDRFLGSKRRHSSSYASPPHLAGDCGVWHDQGPSLAVPILNLK
ncbi:MAG: hypothetical protein ACLUGT_05040, partial [Lactobacillaceae bacterium]